MFLGIVVVIHSMIVIFDHGCQHGSIEKQKKHEDHTQSCIVISDDMNMTQCSIKLNHTIEIIEGP